MQLQVQVSRVYTVAGKVTVGRQCFLALESRSQCLVSLHEVRNGRSVILLRHFVSYIFGFPFDSHHSAVARPATALTMVRIITPWAAVCFGCRIVRKISPLFQVHVRPRCMHICVCSGKPIS